jgi:hypothetical protein
MRRNSIKQISIFSLFWTLLLPMLVLATREEGPRARQKSEEDAADSATVSPLAAAAAAAAFSSFLPFLSSLAASAVGPSELDGRPLG